MRPTVTVEFRIDTESGVPFYGQIIHQAKPAIACVNRRPVDRLPTVRHLALDLSHSPNTVSHAHRALEVVGLVGTKQGSGLFIGRRLVVHLVFEPYYSGRPRVSRWPRAWTHSHRWRW